jgi:hypothetical protein
VKAGAPFSPRLQGALVLRCGQRAAARADAPHRGAELRVYTIDRSIGTTLSFEAMVSRLNAAHRLIDFDLRAVLVELPGLRDLSLHLARPASPEACTEAQEACPRSLPRLAGGSADHPRIVIIVITNQAARLPRAPGRASTFSLRRGRSARWSAEAGCVSRGRTRLLNLACRPQPSTASGLQEAEIRVRPSSTRFPADLMTDIVPRDLREPAARALSPFPGRIGAPSVLRPGRCE